MNELVEVMRKEVWAESNLVARKMGVKHKDMMRVIRTVIGKINNLRGMQSPPKYTITKRAYRGREFEICLMSREFFSLVMMRFETQKAFEWQVKFNSAFYAMEKRLLQVEINDTDIEWTQTRLIGKSSRLEETDVIKDFIEYATAQGSKSAGFYYKHVTNATYKALGLMSQKKPKLRDQMDIYQISELMLAERLAGNKIAEYMALGRDYKDIYSSVRDDLLSFAKSLKIT